jgi:hypothetical protein
VWTSATRDHVAMQDLRRFFKANPQVLVLLIICLVLGLGTFLAVIFGVATSKNPTTPSGEPSGALTPRVTLVARADGRPYGRPHGATATLERSQTAVSDGRFS